MFFMNGREKIGNFWWRHLLQTDKNDKAAGCDSKWGGGRVCEIGNKTKLVLKLPQAVL
jgi:hypothetical protein